MITTMNHDDEQILRFDPPLRSSEMRNRRLMLQSTYEQIVGCHPQVGVPGCKRREYQWNFNSITGFQVARVDCICRVFGRLVNKQRYLKADAAKAIRVYDSDAMMKTLQSHGT